MPIHYAGNVVSLGRFNTYRVAGNYCKSFVVGEIGSEDDFYIVAAEPPDESSYPLITGTFLNSDGQVLFTLLRNQLSLNPGHCSKILGNCIGYEIHDANDRLIFKVETRYVERLAEAVGGNFVTTIYGEFYNKHRELVFSAASGEDGDQITANTKHGFSGWTGGFPFGGGMNDEEILVASTALATGGTIRRVLRGRIEGDTLNLDGTLLINCHLVNCTLLVSTGDFQFSGLLRIDECRIEFRGKALGMRLLYQAGIPREIQALLPPEFLWPPMIE